MVMPINALTKPLEKNRRQQRVIGLVYRIRATNAVLGKPDFHRFVKILLYLVSIVLIPSTLFCNDTCLMDILLLDPV